MEKVKEYDRSEKTYDHILKYTGLFGGIQGITILLSILRNKCVATFIGSAGIGLVDLYNRTLDLLSNTTNFGISFSAVRQLSEYYERGEMDKLSDYVKLVRSWSLWTAILGVVVCCAFSPLISLYTFHDYQFIHQFFALSPIVGMMAICGGEMAILKGIRKLKKIAVISVFGALATLLLTIPIYVFLGVHGIVPALVICSAAVTAIQLFYTTRIFPWRVSLVKPSFLKRGANMLKLGVAYILAGIVGSGAEILVRNYIFHHDSLSTLGLYTAGFALTVTYARIVFVAMDADYFPRLSTAMNDTGRMNEMVNRQIEVCVLLMAPFLVFFMLFLPFIVHLLYTIDFLTAVPMTLAASFYMYFKAVTSPIAYLSLAKGDSITYFVMELLYDGVFVGFVVAGFACWGLIGAGIGLSLSNLFDLLLISTVYHNRYAFRFSRHALSLVLLQCLFVALGLLLACQEQALLKYSVGGIVFLVSASISLRIFRRDTNLTAALKGFIRERITKKSKRP